MSVAGSYTDAVGMTPVWFSVRWHKKLIRQGEIGGAGQYAGIIENVNKLIFSTDEIAVASVDDYGTQWGGVVPQRLGQVFIPAYQITLTLDSLDVDDGPIRVVWNVVQDVGL
jgi:hypothetical protein